MQKQINQLIEFHTAFGVPFKLGFDYEPLDNVTMRRNLMIEEVKEWSSAAECEALIEARAKELADILYTVLGTVITEGLQDHIEKVFDLVHESNMTKLGADGFPVKRHDGKITKGPYYKEPDLSFLKDTIVY